MKKILKNVDINSVIPYENNPRHNDQAVEAVAESIRQCEYIAPIIVDENMVILAGHTRHKALQLLGEENIEVMIIEGLTEEQKIKFRLLDNKTNEFSGWDWSALDKELEGLDFENYDFGLSLDDIDIDALFNSLSETPEKKTKTVICSHCGKEFEL